nr:MAG TPA: hypothetical protein [Caudoviricetes sp.]
MKRAALPRSCFDLICNGIALHGDAIDLRRTDTRKNI